MLTILLTQLACDPCPTGQTCQPPASGTACQPGEICVDPADANTVPQEVGLAWEKSLWEANTVAENHEGVYTVVMRRSNSDAKKQWSELGVLVVKKSGDPVGNPSAAPNYPATEYYCTRDYTSPAQGFSWPRMIGTGKADTWLLFPKTEYPPGLTTIDCVNGLPEKIHGSSLQREFNFAPCDPTLVPPAVGACPLTPNSGTHLNEANPVIGLNPGIYKAIAHRQAAAIVDTGEATVYVRATAVPKVFVETWCYDANFLWPRVTQTPLNGVVYNSTWWEFSAQGGAAPAAGTCPVTNPALTRKDFSYTLP